MTIPPEYIDTIPEEFKEEFSQLVNTGIPSKMNEAFIRFSILGSAKTTKAIERLKDAVKNRKKYLEDELEKLGRAELIPLTRKERFSDTFEILKEDVVKRYKNIKGEE